MNLHFLEKETVGLINHVFIFLSRNLWSIIYNQIPRQGHHLAGSQAKALWFGFGDHDMDLHRNMFGYCFLMIINKEEFMMGVDKTKRISS